MADEPPPHHSSRSHSCCGDDCRCRQHHLHHRHPDGSVAAMAAAVRQGRLSRQSLERHYRGMCLQLNPGINAVCHLCPASSPVPLLLPPATRVGLGVDSDKGATYTASRDSASADADGSAAVARPLEGIPFLVKDLVHVAGVPTACGDMRLATLPPPPSSASAVSLLQSLGAVPIGKTNVPALSMDFQTFNGVFGVTCNPLNHSLTPGGSSGGSAAAVAAGMVLFALGTDLEGSLRLPASFCSLCSLRPSRDRWPVLGSDVPLPSLGLLSSLHTYGVFTRTMEDLQFIMSVVLSRLPPPPPLLPASPPPRSPPRSPCPPLRVAVSGHLPGAPVDSRISLLFQALAATPMPASMACSDPAYAAAADTGRKQGKQHQHQHERGGRQQVEFVLTDAPRLDFKALDKASKEFIFAAQKQAQRHQSPGPQGSKNSGESRKSGARNAVERDRNEEEEAERQQWEAEVGAARRTQQQQQAVVDAFLSDNNLAAWILPVASVLPFPHNPQHQPLTIAVSGSDKQQAQQQPQIQQQWQQVPYPRALRSFTMPLTITGHPVVGMPLGWIDGLPCGMQVVGPMGQDIPLLRLCCQIEAHLQEAGGRFGTTFRPRCSSSTTSRPLFARSLHSCL